MSKIYRRPMFRGGGKVSSYGNGIAAPLVPGYQMGGNVSGGIVNLPGGYALTADQRLASLVAQKRDLNSMNIPTLPSNVSQDMMLGSEILAAARNRMTQNDAYRGVPKGVVINNDPPTDAENDDAQLVENLTGLDGQGGMEGEFESVTKVDGTGSDTSTTNDAVYGTVKPYIGAQEGMDKSTSMIIDGVLSGDRGGSDEIKEQLRREKIGGRDLGYQDELMLENYKKSKADAATNSAKKVTDLLTGKGGDGGESTSISAKDAIRENQELFKDLLGSKKARGQDISDMLLRFSGSEGNTVGEKFKNYTKVESAAGPGRGEKINQTAAALAINDYVAGKRSKEQAEVLKGKIDYEYGKKGQMVNVQPGDDVQTALFKIAKKGDVKPNSDAALKYLIGMKDSSATGNKVFRQDKLDLDDIVNKEGLVSKKAKKRLKIGYNIIEEDGVKNIVTWDGTNYDILTIGEIWTR